MFFSFKHLKNKNAICIKKIKKVLFWAAALFKDYAHFQARCISLEPL